MKKNNKYQGVVVPMITPLTSSLDIDTDAVARIVSRFAAHNVSALLMGTTGEGNLVSTEQGEKLVAAAAKAAQGRITIYVGLAGCCLSEQLDAAQRYAKAGADVVAATLPSYYELTPEQMFDYYKALADKLPLPLMLYNITKTTHMSIPLDIIERLSHHPNIVGLKDSQNDVPRMEEAMRLFAHRDDFAYFCGCSANSAASLRLGADGIVPSMGNLLPEAYQELYVAARDGKEEKAEKLQRETAEICKINTVGLTLGQSLAGLKVMMNEAQLCDTYMLPPLTTLDTATEERIRQQTRNILNNL